MRQLLDLFEDQTFEVHWKPSRIEQQRIRAGELAVVWVDIEKFDRSFAKDSLYVGPGGEGGIRTRYPDFGKWLAQSTGPVEMSEVGFGGYGQIAFINGRHRYSWMRDHGAQALPVLTYPENVPEMERRFGTSLRKTILTSGPAPGSEIPDAA
jgi:hypothetical protein